MMLSANWKALRGSANQKSGYGGYVENLPKGTFVDINANLVLLSDIWSESVVTVTSPTAIGINTLAVCTFVAFETFVDLDTRLAVIGGFISGVTVTVP